MGEKLLAEERQLDTVLNKFLKAYVKSLYRASLREQSAATLQALDELNAVLIEKKLPPVSLKGNAMREAILAANNYKKMLLEGGGYYVVIQAGDTEKLEFRPWLNDLRDDTKKRVLEIWDQARTDNWTGARIDLELRKLEEFMINKRARVAAFTETRTQQYMATMRTWDAGGLEFMERRAVDAQNVCLTCAVLDHRVFRMGDQPPLSHPNCRCFYTPYITKRAWSPDYDKSEWDAEGYAVGPKFEYEHGGRNMIPYENTAIPTRPGDNV